MLLNSFFKRILRNDGIMEDQDDIFKLVFTEKRQKISDQLRSRPEVQTAMYQLLNEHVKTMSLDRIVSCFSFMCKSAYPVSDEDLKRLFKAFKRNIVKMFSELPIENPDTKQMKHIQDVLTCMAIFIKQCHKLSFDKAILNYIYIESPHIDSSSPKSDENVRHALIKDMFAFLLPYLEKYQEYVSLTEASMSIRSFLSYDMIPADLTTAIFKKHQAGFPNATSMELYSILDMIIEINLKRMKELVPDNKFGNPDRSLIKLAYQDPIISDTLEITRSGCKFNIVIYHVVSELTDRLRVETLGKQMTNKNQKIMGFEVSQIVKIITNKSRLIDIKAVPEIKEFLSATESFFTQSIVKDANDRIIGTNRDLSMIDLLQILNGFARYHLKVGEDFLKLVTKFMEVELPFLRQFDIQSKKDRHYMSLKELYRLINAAIYLSHTDAFKNGDQIDESKGAYYGIPLQLLTDYLIVFVDKLKQATTQPNSFSQEELKISQRMLHSLIGRMSQYRVKIDTNLYNEIRNYNEALKKELMGENSNSQQEDRNANRKQQRDSNFSHRPSEERKKTENSDLRTYPN